MELKLFKLLILYFFFLPIKSFSQDAFDFYISNKGNNNYTGTIKLLPKKTITATAPLIKSFFNANGGVKIGLKSGDLFEESLVTSYPIKISTYTGDNNQNDFAILNGSKEFDTGWTKDTNRVNTYKQDIPYSGFNSYGINGIGSYSYIYVIEVDKALEKTAPFTARKILKFVTSLVELEKSPGSFYSPVNTTENPKLIYLHTSDGSSVIYGGGSDNGKIVATGNIFICDIISPATLIAAFTNTNNGMGTSKDNWDNNVYVLLKGNRIAWKVNNASSKGGSYLIQSFDEWKRQSGQDTHSLFFDLRNDPRGLKAILADPDNGNYDLANTVEGRQIAALRGGMSSPITCFLQKPTYEAAADLVSNSKVLSVNSCRNPCQQNKIRVNSTFEITGIKNREVKLQWNIPEQQNISHYELQKATGNSVFKRINSIPVSQDSLYSFIDNAVQAGIPYQYRLLLFAQAGEICYSDIRTIKIIDQKAFTIYPNPSTGKFFISMNGYIRNANFSILNSMGQPILKKEFLSLYSTQLIDLSNKPKGIYFIKMETSNGTSTQKFLIE